MMELPFISVLVPCRNEENYISACLDSLLENDYPKDRLQIIVIDGYSEDKSRNIIKEYKARYDFIKLLDNQRKTYPSALNLGIEISSGDPVLIIGSHATYDKRYISKCIEYSLLTGADNVGGILITLPKTDNFIGRLIVKTLTNKFGVGGSAFRTGTDKAAETDTIFGGCYRREVFRKIGFFNENLISTSDYEFNRRLKNNGGMILLNPEIKAYYYTRSSVKDFLVNNFRNGYWSVYPLAFVSYLPVAFRHLVPLIFVLSLIFLTIISFLLPVFKIVLLTIILVYFTLAYYFAIKEEKAIIKLLLPFFFLSLHIIYGLGSLYALFKLPFAQKK